VRAQLGWTLLSREALKRAQAQLAEDIQGVRDEIGFLAIHQAYADRFFPGTSVLHTRLRYVLFVPWLYQRIKERGNPAPIDRQLQAEELRLTGRLKKSNEKGVIGGRTYPRPSVQPPSMVYWTALGTWGILRPMPNGEVPGRAVIHRLLAGQRRGRIRLLDDEHQLLEEEDSFFSTLPRPPSEWSDPNKALDFTIRRAEAVFLRKCLLSVRRPGIEGAPSLLAQIVDSQTALHPSVELWSSKISRVADADDQPALVRARQAAAISAIGRAIYSALLEDTLDRFDKISVSNQFRHHLGEVISEYRSDALALDIEKMQGDSVWGVNTQIIKILHRLQDWLRSARPSLQDLHRPFAETERYRKGQRARLPMTISAREKRAEWASDPPPLAEPLHYRWPNVLRLLIDLTSVR
jgi:hypothetical protein